MSRKIPDSHFRDLRERYERGESVLSMSRIYGVDRITIGKRLRGLGLSVRTGREAQLIRMGRMSPEQRAANARKAHDAVRGRVVAEAELLMRAANRQARPIIYPYERQLIGILADRGIQTIPQLAIGPYNCDIAAFPVAVEIFGGNWHWTGRHMARTPKRVRYLLNAGWHILMIWCGRNGNDPVPHATDVADYVASYIQAARSNPTAVREYRVIRGAGDTWAFGNANDDDIAIEHSLRRRLGPARQRYRR